MAPRPAASVPLPDSAANVDRGCNQSSRHEQLHSRHQCNNGQPTASSSCARGQKPLSEATSRQRSARDKASLPPQHKPQLSPAGMQQRAAERRPKANDGQDQRAGRANRFAASQQQGTAPLHRQEQCQLQEALPLKLPTSVTVRRQGRRARRQLASPEAEAPAEPERRRAATLLPLSQPVLSTLDFGTPSPGVARWCDTLHMAPESEDTA